MLTAATAPAQAGTAGEATIQSCYGSADSYNKPAGGLSWPVGIFLETTGNCADINIRTNNNTFVRVCFAGETGSKCQADFKRATAGQWTTVATNVKDKVWYYFQFYNDGASSGLYAA